MGEERVYRVQGMACSHCQAAVMEEVGALPGVTAVEVDLGTGRVTVHGERIDDEAVAGAVVEKLRSCPHNDRPIPRRPEDNRRLASRRTRNGGSA